MEATFIPARKSRFNPRVVFVVIFVLYVMVLSLRPIPDELSTNDLGRYLAEFKDFNSLPWLEAMPEDFSRFLFYTVMKPVGWLGGPRLFMFASAITLPLAFLLLGRWRKGGILWAMAALFCFAGFDLQTNALRQGLGVLVLFLALRLVLADFMVLGIAIGGISALFHTSNTGFLPLLVMLAVVVSRKKANSRLKITLPLVVVGALATGALYLFLNPTVFLRWFLLYQGFYTEPQSPAFNLFMSSPILYVFLVRKWVFPRVTTRIETLTIAYSGVLILATIFFFPAIAFRYTLTSCILQIFVSMNTENATLRQGFYTLVGLFFHLLIILTFSTNIRSVIYR